MYNVHRTYCIKLEKEGKEGTMHVQNTGKMRYRRTYVLKNYFYRK